MNDSKISTFPRDKHEALAMLYLQSQDLSNVTPEELLDKYEDAYQKIRQRNAKKDSANW